MAVSVVVVVCCIIICFSSLVSAVLAWPPPAQKTTDIDGYKQVASDRAVYNTTQEPGRNDEYACAKDCTIDWTCKGFNSWYFKDQFGIKTYQCLKQTTKINPWMTLPAWFTGKKASKIFIKV